MFFVMPQKNLRVKELQDLEPDRDSFLYDDIYSTDGVTQQQIQVKHSWKSIH